MTSRLTDLQLRFWAERGFLIIKGAFSPQELGSLWQSIGAGHHDFEARRRLASTLCNRLHPWARLLVGDDVVTLDVARAGPTSAPLHLDAWEGPESDGNRLSFLVALTSIGGGSAPLFYPGSHMMDEQGKPTGHRADFVHLAARLRSEGAMSAGLSCAPGDVWIRHPRLLHGSILAGIDKWAGLAVRCCRASALPQDSVTVEVTGSCNV